MKHLTLEERMIIENMLKDGCSFTEIGKAINKDRTTIAKEVKNHRCEKQIGQYNSNFASCKSVDICADAGTYKCHRERCKDFLSKECDKLKSAPYVCNGCSKRYCRLDKQIYSAKFANDEYSTFKSDSREGFQINKEQVDKINTIISPLLKDQKQSINHIYINHPDDLPFAMSTFYNYINANLFNFDNCSLCRKVKLKPRKNTQIRRKRTELAIRIGRTYEDYKEYLKARPNASVVEMDTVEGVKGGKVFLTLLFTYSNLMLIYLLDKKNTDCVTKVFEKLKKDLGIEEYKRLFEVVLTDNGSEFFYPQGIEIDHKNCEILSHVFYCNPGASYQKGSIERNHEFIRYALPKGSSFNDLTQEDCYKLASHINSIARVSLKQKTPFEAVSSLIHSACLKLLNIEEISCDHVNLSSKLLKK